MDQHNEVSRRNFMKTSVAAGAIAGGFNILNANGAGQAKTFTVGLIGCGGRGNGALGNFISACKHLGLQAKVVGTADWFKSKAERVGKRHGLAGDKCFEGALGYRKVLEQNPDIILTATPPAFRPVHFEASVEAGKHVFMEKPVAVDPQGARRIIAAGEKAKQKGLAVVAGTQRRHQANYRRMAHAIHEGAIGNILNGQVYWCGRVPWVRKRQEGQSDADYLANNWLNWSMMSGDHIVEQHVHNLDVANWFIGRVPVSVLGFGGRHQRKTGDQFDHFSLSIDYGEDCHIHSMCSQRTGCYTRVGENFVGTKGNASDIRKDKSIKTPEFPEHGGPYVQEHVDFLNSILADKPLNEAENVANATMVAIMGRMAAYTGQVIRWVDVMSNEKSKFFNYTCTPTAEAFEKGDVKAPKDDVIAIPGR